MFNVVAAISVGRVYTYNTYFQHISFYMSVYLLLLWRALICRARVILLLEPEQRMWGIRLRRPLGTKHV